MIKKALTQWISSSLLLAILLSPSPALGAFVFSDPLFGAPTQAGPNAVINEFVFNHDGVDTHEYIEVYGVPERDYSHLTLLQIEGDADMGTIDSAIRLGVSDEHGFWHTGFLDNEFENGSLTLLLVEGFRGAKGNDLDPGDDCTMDLTPWDAILDQVAVHDGDEGDCVYSNVILTPKYDGFAYAPGGGSRLPDGVDSDSANDWMRNDFYLAGLEEYPGMAPVSGQAYNTPGTRNLAADSPLLEQHSTQATPVALSIYDVQFSPDPENTDRSPYEDSFVSVEGVLSVAPRQFALEAPAELLVLQAPGGMPWSGLIVFSPGGFSGFMAPLGTQLSIRGRVQEYYSLTELITPGTPEDVSLLSIPSGRLQPQVITTDSLAHTASAEAWEGMLVEIGPVRVDEKDLEYGEWTVRDDQGVVLVGSLGDLSYRPWRHDVIYRLDGIVWYSFGAYKLQPRTDADIRLLAMSPTMR